MTTMTNAFFQSFIVIIEHISCPLRYYFLFWVFFFFNVVYYRMQVSLPSPTIPKGLVNPHIFTNPLLSDMK